MNRASQKACALWQRNIKNNSLRTLDEVYAKLGCTKTDISRWGSNPCSTHAVCRRAKISVIIKSKRLFSLSKNECESLANKAGLSLLYDEKILLSDMLEIYNGKNRKSIQRSSVSERMLQYYLNGMEPTKQALLAIFIAIGLSVDKIDGLLHKYGYCLSRSLPNDVIVRWHLQKHYTQINGAVILQSINEILEKTELPLLMTKLINR